MTLSEKKEIFAVLGKFMLSLGTSGDDSPVEVPVVVDEGITSRFRELIDEEEKKNPWFTPDNVKKSLYSLGKALSYENLEKWLAAYPIPEGPLPDPVDVGVIMAGNIPLVGFHDFLSVIFSGHRLTAKLSTKDDRLLPLLMEVLFSLDHGFSDLVRFEAGPLKNPGAVIATGSNNSSRYFDYYFGKFPNIIRKNRNSTAILDGSETKEELRDLAGDIFSYFGLGCRNVSKIYLPEDYEIAELLDCFQDYAFLAYHHKYANNYEYQRAIQLVNRAPFYDTGFLVVREDASYSSPVGCLHYERYGDREALERRLEAEKDLLQCIVGKNIKNRTKFGQTQNPMLWDYADNVDTIEFLINLHKK
jgi:hypothetical protein